MKKSVPKKLMCVAVALILVLAAVTLSTDLAVKSSAGGKIFTPEEYGGETAECILVLGAGVRADGSPTWMLQGRLDTAIELYNMGAAPIILMSGDSVSENYDEVGTMVNYAIDAGVPESAVIADTMGISTYDSVYRAKNIFGFDSAVTVSQRYHLYRALHIAERLELSAVGVCDPFTEYPGQLPRDIREILARVKDYFECLVLPEPEYTESAG